MSKPGDKGKTSSKDSGKTGSSTNGGGKSKVGRKKDDAGSDSGKKTCQRRSNRCYNCDEERHFSRDYKKPKEDPKKDGDSSGKGRAQ